MSDSTSTPLDPRPTISGAGLGPELGAGPEPGLGAPPNTGPYPDQDQDHGARLPSLVGLLIGYALLITGNGLLNTLVSLRMVHEQWPALTVGLVQSCYYAGFMAGALINGGLIVRIGHHRTFIALAALATLASLGYLLFDQPLVWALLRALFGYCLVGIYTALESGMHASATNAQRGRVFASYLAITYLGISVGQFLLRVGGPSGNLQSVLVAALIVSSLVPVTLMDGWPERRAAALMPILAGDRWDGLRELLRSAPLGVPVCIGAGLLSSAFYTMMPVYLVQLGYDVPGVARFMGIALLCALAAQWPAGRLSDRVERRTVIFCVTLAAGGTSALLALLPWPWAIDAVGFVYVSLTFTLYGLIVSHVNDLVDRRRRVAVSAALLLLFAIGGLLGPTIASLCIARFGPAGLFIFTLTICAGLAAMTWPNREPKPQ